MLFLEDRYQVVLQFRMVFATLSIAWPTESSGVTTAHESAHGKVVMNVLLVQPSLNPKVTGPQTDYLVEPMALELLGANLPNHEVFLSDLRVEDDLIDKISSLQPQLVGITCCAMTEVPVCRTIAKTVKDISPSTRVVLGGQHPTFSPEDFLDCGVDYIVRGEGEKTFAELVDVLEQRPANVNDLAGIAVVEGKRCYTTRSRPQIQDLDSIAVPDRALVARFKHAYYKGRNVATVLTSRGCPYRCSFCTIWKFFASTYRQRSSESVRREIEALDTDMIHMADDTFMYDTAWSWRMLEALRSLSKPRQYKFWVRPDIVVRNPELLRAWVEIGLRTACIGLESCDSGALARMHKGTTLETNNKALEILLSLGVEIVPNFIISPSYEAKDFNRLASYVRHWQFSAPVFTVLTPLVGTDFYDEMRDHIVETRPEKYDLVHPVIPTKLTTREFAGRFYQLYEEFYFGQDHLSQVAKREEMPHFIEHESVERSLHTFRETNAAHS